MPRLLGHDPTYAIEHKFKWARIKKLDYTMDTCDIIILDKDKNETDEEYNNVPIFYHCEPEAKQRSNGALEGASAAFELGDNVLVRFEEGTPIVVARLDGLKPCLAGFLFCHGFDYDKVKFSEVEGPDFRKGEPTICEDGGYGEVAKYDSDKKILYHDAVKCWSGTITGQWSGAIGYIESCKYPYYLWQTEELPNYTEYEKKSEPRFPVQEICAHGCGSKGFVCGRSWSKTYEDITITAFLWKTEFMYLWRWSVAATKNNRQLYFKYGNQNYLYFHPNGSSRYIYETDTDLRTCHIGFDIWEEEGSIKVGIANDDGGVFVFRLNGEYLKIESTPFSTFRSWWASYRCDMQPEWKCADVAQRHFRLIGYDGPNYKLYWCWFNQNTYYEEDLKTHSITEHKLGNWPEETDGIIVDAIWNPIERKPYFFYKSGSKLLNLPKEVYADFPAHGEWTHGDIVAILDWEWTEGGGLEPASGQGHPYGPISIEVDCGSWGTLTSYYGGHAICCSAVANKVKISKEYRGGEGNVQVFGPAGIKSTSSGIAEWDRGKIKNYTDIVAIYVKTYTTSHYSGDCNLEHEIYDEFSVSGEGCEDCSSWCLDGDSNCVTNAKSGVDCIPEGRKEIYLNYWQFNASGVSAVLTKIKKIKVLDEETGNYKCVDDDEHPETEIIGDKMIADTNEGDEFPWDSGWEAILLKGTIKGKTIKNHVVYSIKDESKFLVKPIGKIFNGVRAFYQKIRGK